MISDGKTGFEREILCKCFAWNKICDFSSLCNVFRRKWQPRMNAAGGRRQLRAPNNEEFPS